ncbi:MAG: hypothetical protein KAR38_03430 [Calditrichia bacterium]|nr:hypothetical protein [Calditrichia bacterium]
MKNTLILNLIFFIILNIFFSCETTNKKIEDKINTSTKADSAQAFPEFNKLYANVQPDWIISIDSIQTKYPEFLFISGEGVSKNLGIAKSKSTFNAREKLVKSLLKIKNPRSENSEQKFDMELTNTRILQYYVEKKGVNYKVQCLIAHKN